MHKYQQDFLDFAIQHDVLRLGDFVLKSGRKSPYFFNTGLFNTGRKLASLGEYYAKTLVDSKKDFDMLFGPAYKGITIVSAMSIALSNKYNLDFPYSFNRKEQKDHGEGGKIAGAKIQGRVLIVDDVISSGESILKSIEIIENEGGKASGVLISLNRQERGANDMSAIEEIEKTFNIPVISIVKLEHIISYLEQKDTMSKMLEKMCDYRKKYGTDL